MFKPTIISTSHDYSRRGASMCLVLTDQAILWLLVTDDALPVAIGRKAQTTTYAIGQGISPLPAAAVYIGDARIA